MTVAVNRPRLQFLQIKVRADARYARDQGRFSRVRSNVRTASPSGDENDPEALTGFFHSARLKAETIEEVLIINHLLNTDFVILAGAAGVLAGLVLLLIFLYRRILFMAKKLGGKPTAAPKLLKSLRNLLLILLWTSVFGMLLFAGFFFRAYRAFTLEEPVAEVIIGPKGEAEMSSITIIQDEQGRNPRVRQFEVTGDQWVLEGDILKWRNWLNFLGLHTRYRLTRLTSRYLRASDEMAKPRTVYPLVENEDSPLWRFLYKYGPRFPVVSTVYGNAVFQSSGEGAVFRVYVGTSGFIARKHQLKE